jgi:hypothetical protein
VRHQQPFVTLLDPLMPYIRIKERILRCSFQSILMSSLIFVACTTA